VRREAREEGREARQPPRKAPKARKQRRAHGTIGRRGKLLSSGLGGLNHLCHPSDLWLKTGVFHHGVTEARRGGRRGIFSLVRLFAADSALGRKKAQGAQDRCEGVGDVGDGGDWGSPRNTPKTRNRRWAHGTLGTPRKTTEPGLGGLNHPRHLRNPRLKNQASFTTESPSHGGRKNWETGETHARIIRVCSCPFEVGASRSKQAPASSV
jgi:hypothetical protein